MNKMLRVLALIAVGITTWVVGSDGASSQSQSPLAMATLSLPGESRSAFLSALKTFAEEEGFAIRIAPLEPTEQRYSIDLRRVDVSIFGSNPFDTSTYMFGVYENASGSVGAVEGAAVLDMLISAVALVPELRVNPE